MKIGLVEHNILPHFGLNNALKDLADPPNFSPEIGATETFKKSPETAETMASLVLTDSKNGGIMLSAQIVLSDHMQLLVVVMMTTNPFRRGHSLKQSQNTKGFHMGCSEKSTNMATSISSVFSSGAT